MLRQQQSGVLGYTVVYYVESPIGYLYSPSGPIQLGNIITCVKTPERPLYKAPKLDDSTAFSTTQKQVIFSTERFSGGKFGIFTRFLNVVLGLGVGVDVTVGWEMNDSSCFTFESTNTSQFFPEPGYIQDCISTEPVRRYLEKFRYRKPVYIITSLKIAKGVTVQSLKTKTVDGGVSAGADATSWAGVPIAGGIEAGRNIGSKDHASWEGSSDFIFAFRVRRVLVERKTGVVRKEEEYKKGAMLESVTEKRDGSELSIIEQEEDMEDELEGFSKKELTEGNEVVLCAIPGIQGGPPDTLE
ncbi:hypothetical protein F5B22DRAFT_636624 [Xylaria bambusicola]|uniref:uncharacterized protein n=1 Tax=Xylaria bambusicola TaxID=326684 RepID=UPI00200734ED|nr:uncharacterized protein F5B22DRAFT_636624 [Xylaria bambusicola]KAI0515048.1 hypothetical protein F5B22DRAFT_636624 [Xylaria bambusicola]